MVINLVHFIVCNKILLFYFVFHKKINEFNILDVFKIKEILILLSNILYFIFFILLLIIYKMYNCFRKGGKDKAYRFTLIYLNVCLISSL